MNTQRARRLLALTAAGLIGAFAAAQETAREAEAEGVEAEGVEAENSAADNDSAEQRMRRSIAQSVAQSIGQNMEEVVVIARLFNSAQQLMNERKDDEVVSDVMSDEMIGRIGDTTVAVALQRISGLSLVGGKFIYVRGLGERYSSTLLNGATVPSPDLTRNVIPLDIFPTAIVESLRVQKSYSADMPAAFGGGAVDIRTKAVPNAFTYAIEAGSGYNMENDSSALSYPGGGSDRFGTDDGTRAMSPELSAGIARFLGNIDIQGILSGLRREGNANATVADAQRVNRELALLLNRNISIAEKPVHPDYDIKASIGNNLLLGNSGYWEAGFQFGAAYKAKWRQSERLSRNFNFPDERTDSKRESTFAVDITANANFGLRYADDHEISTTSLYLRNTDDETAIRDFFNENREISDERGFRDYRLQFEERDLAVHQIKGTHRFGDASRELPVLRWFDREWIPRDLEISWFYSDAEASTNIPNQVNVVAQTVTAPISGQVLRSSVNVGTTATYRFTLLEDDALNYGWQAMLPLAFVNSYLELAGGYQFSRKARTYRQSQFSLNALSVSDPSILRQGLGEALADRAILDPANNYVFDLSGTNNQSYIAAIMTDAVFGKVDWTLRETWRISAGARWEDYKQVALDWNLYGFTIDNPVVTTDVERLKQASFAADDIYPSVSLTWIGSLWEDRGVELFQLRFGWSETVVRPDLREITDASYIDPITDDLVDGNPGVSPSDMTNYDVRAEWFFNNGDHFTTSLFLKDIANPIEFFESAASDTTVAREIVNAESAQVYGVELEGLKELGFLGRWAEPLFVQGNLTWQSSELVAGEQADAPTNNVRPLAGASEYVVNMLLGFDSVEGNHSATLTYNVFGERLYVAGRLGAPDGYQQPFHSLDFSYAWYPSATITVKAKLRNILDQAVEIQREGVVTFSERPGMSAALSFKWEY